jgi:hypothetical protein
VTGGVAGDEAGDVAEDDAGGAAVDGAGKASGCAPEEDGADVPDGGDWTPPSARPSPRARRASVTAAAPATPSQEADSKTRVLTVGSLATLIRKLRR